MHRDSVRLLERRALQAALSVLPKAQPRCLVMASSPCSKVIVTPAWSWMRIPDACCGSVKAAAEQRSGLSSKNWAPRVVLASKRWRWLLLRNPQNLNTPEQQVRLEDLLAANHALMTVYLMKAELKTLCMRSINSTYRMAGV
jgi:hypothetical protein